MDTPKQTVDEVMAKVIEAMNQFRSLPREAIMQGPEPARQAFSRVDRDFTKMVISLTIVGEALPDPVEDLWEVI